MPKELKEKIDEANQQAVERIVSSQPVLIDIKPAIETVPGMSKTTILHAAPSIQWKKMCDPMRGAVMGALIYEGLAENPEDACELAGSGSIKFSPCHHHNSVGPMAGVISASMPVFIVKNEMYGNTAYCTLNEGLGKVLRFGAYDRDVIQRLKWLEETLAPALREALKQSTGINLKNIIFHALRMGDECKNRNLSGTYLFLNEITPFLLETGLDKKGISVVVKFIVGNRHFFLNLSMPASKATMDATHGIENCTIVTAMASNGTEFGIRVSGLGDKWFTAPAPQPEGLYFPGYSAEDANPELGDSGILETAGLGGFAMAASPTIVKFVGGTPLEAINYTKEMGEITVTKNNSYPLPPLNFEGTPTGIDIRKVIGTGIVPIMNTGMAHKKAGIGGIGAGLVRAPIECFKKALKAMVERSEL